MSAVEAAPRRGRALPIAGALLFAIVVASIGNTLVAVVAHAAGASDGFRPLEPATFVPLTAIGTLVGALGWWLVARTRRGVATLRWLVPLVLTLSLVPDVLVGVTEAQPHTTWTGVVGLMAMHLVVAAVAVPTYARFLPIKQPSLTA